MQISDDDDLYEHISNAKKTSGPWQCYGHFSSQVDKTQKTVDIISIMVSELIF